MAGCASLGLKVNARALYHVLLYFKGDGLVVLAVKIDDWVVLVGCVGERCQLSNGWLRPQLRDPMILLFFGKVIVETAFWFRHITISIILNKGKKKNSQRLHKPQQESNFKRGESLLRPG